MTPRKLCRILSPNIRIRSSMDKVRAVGSIGTRDLAEIIHELTSAKLVGVDTECSSLSDKELIGLAISPNMDYAVWFSAEDNPYLHIALGILRSPAVKKVFHNCKFDFDVLEPYQIDETNYEDTEILAYVRNLPQRLYNLASMLRFHVPDKYYNWEFPDTGTMLDIWKSDPDFVIGKCCLDATLTLKCWYKLCESPVAESYLIDRDIVHILRHMEHAGIAVNEISVNEWNQILDEETSYMRQLIATKGCDPNSNKQVGIALAQLGYRLPWTKSRKQLKVDERILSYIDHPLAQSVLLYREKAKLKSTYVDPLVGVDRVFTTYSNTRVITGRLSSGKPRDYTGPLTMINMQNIPEFYREVFIPDNDNDLFSYDASQIELRTIAYLAQDKAMLEAFANHKDIHEDTNKRMGLNNRKIAKILNFATAYLGTEETIIEGARKAGIKLSLPQASDFIRRYFQTYPGLKDYTNSQREVITKYGLVTTLYGRIRKADQTRMASPHSREAVIRELFNMPVQGTAAEIIKKMMAKTGKFDMRIQVHDEMVFNGSCPAPSMLESLAPFETPLKLKIGKNWGEMEETKF